MKYLSRINELKSDSDNNIQELNDVFVDIKDFDIKDFRISNNRNQYNIIWNYSTKYLRPQYHLNSDRIKIIKFAFNKFTEHNNEVYEILERLISMKYDIIVYDCYSYDYMKTYEIIVEKIN